MGLGGAEPIGMCVNGRLWGNCKVLWSARTVLQKCYEVQTIYYSCYRGLKKRRWQTSRSDHKTGQPLPLMCAYSHKRAHVSHFLARLEEGKKPFCVFLWRKMPSGLLCWLCAHNWLLVILTTFSASIINISSSLTAYCVLLRLWKLKLLFLSKETNKNQGLEKWHTSFFVFLC